MVLGFMAAWCGPCGTQIEELKKLQASVGSDVVILSVSVDHDHDTPSKLTFKHLNHY